MKIAKRFRWEAAHRLPWHNGDCANLHGHSYRMTVEVTGRPNEQGMLLDFQDIKQLLQPLIKSWDHAILVAKNDEELLGIIQQTNWKHYVFPSDTTTENVVAYVADFLTKPGTIPAINKTPTDSLETNAYRTIGIEGGMIGPIVAVAAVIAAA